MRSYLFASCLSVLFVALSACTAKTVPVTQALSPSATDGILLVSISKQGRGRVVSTVVFRNIDGTNRQKIDTSGGPAAPFWSDDNRDDFHDSTGRGRVFAINLKPGNYEVCHWVLDTGHAVFTPSEEFSVPFEIKAGRSTYVGDFHFAIGRGQNLFGMPLPYLEGAERRDNWARDLAALKRKYPAVNLNEVDFSSLEIIRDVEGEDGPEQRVNMPLYVPPVPQ